MKMIDIQWHFLAQEETRLRMEIKPSTILWITVKQPKMFFHQENNLLMMEINLLLPNLWKVQDQLCTEERCQWLKVKLIWEMGQRNKYLKWIQSVCLALAN
jgi:hypothetical protein